MSATVEKPWRMVFGIHHGTMMTRDSSEEKCASLEACRTAADSAARYYKRTGAKVWFATAHGPNGEHEKLMEGEPYA